MSKKNQKDSNKQVQSTSVKNNKNKNLDMNEYIHFDEYYENNTANQVTEKIIRRNDDVQYKSEDDKKYTSKISKKDSKQDVKKSKLEKKEKYEDMLEKDLLSNDFIAYGDNSNKYEDLISNNKNDNNQDNPYADYDNGSEGADDGQDDYLTIVKNLNKNPTSLNDYVKDKETKILRIRSLS